MARGLEPTAGNIRRVAIASDDDSARWAFSQWALRERARAKFARADEMLFTREALEQASHERVAAWRASRFPSGVLVADLTCGIGGDLIALAARGPAVGFDLDSERAEYAKHNVEVCVQDAGTTTVLVEDSMRAPWTWQYAVADPSRRLGGRRTTIPADFQPDPTEIARRFAELTLGCIKLSPLLRDDFLESLGPRLEFVSFGGECREVTVWCGSDASSGRHAVHVEHGETLLAGGAPPTVETAEGWVYEADPAAIRAHCLGTLASDYELAGLGDSNGYFTGAKRAYSLWLDPYRVLASEKADERALRAALRELNAEAPVVKTRAKGVDPIDWAQRLRSDGQRKVIVAFYPVGRSVRAVVLEKPEQD